MIDALEIQNLALIRRASLNFAPGLTVITGETGAGKTALLNGLKLLVGARAQAGMVRASSDCAVVTGRLFSGSDDMEGMVVKRRVGVDGRSRVSINASLASVAQLSDEVGSCVDICGQHEHQRLLHRRHQQELIDGLNPQIAHCAQTYQEAFARYREAQHALESFYELKSSDEAQANQARYVLSQIDEVNPQEGEVAELEALLPRVEHASALLHATRESYHALGDDDAAADQIRSALNLLQRQVEHDATLEPWVTQLTDALEITVDVAAELRAYQDDLNFDEDEFDQMNERLAALHQLYKQFGPTHKAVMDARSQAAAVLDALDASPEREAALCVEVEQAQTALVDAASQLHRARVHASRDLCVQVNEALRDLDMPQSEICIQVDELNFDAYTSQSPDRLELMYRPSAHVGYAPLTRIASGGEISRVMLAIKAVLGSNDGTDTLIFDEVDAGVGGHAARQVARMIARLATTHQVICVTHLPQIAVMGQVHYVMNKMGDDQEHLISCITRVTDDERIDELARMLSGEVTQSARSHAQTLFDEAHGYRQAMPGGDEFDR